MPPKKRTKNANGANKKPRVEKNNDKEAVIEKSDQPQQQHTTTTTTTTTTIESEYKQKKKYVKKLPMSNKVAPTISDMVGDPLSVLASETWTTSDSPVYDEELVIKIYKENLKSEKRGLAKVTLLEFSQYLEKYLWPFFTTNASIEHVLSIIIMINEKERQDIAIWDTVKTDEKKFEVFFEKVLTLVLKPARKLTPKEETGYIIFMINAFASLEDDVVRPNVLSLVGLPLWKALSTSRRIRELNENPTLRESWTEIESKKLPKGSLDYESAFIPAVLDGCINMLSKIPEKGNFDRKILLNIERHLEFVIDLLSQLPTRRFFRSVIEDRQLTVKCRLSPLAKRAEGRLVNQLLDMISFYLQFEIDDYTGDALTYHEVEERHFTQIHALQALAHKHFDNKLHDFAMASITDVSSRDKLVKYFSRLDDEELKQLLESLLLIDSSSTLDRAAMLEYLVSRYMHHPSQVELLNSMSLFPDETLLWDENMVPFGRFNGETVLALPKLNLQFLTFHDYLLRSFKLFRLESCYEIREDIVDAVKRVKAVSTLDGTVCFNGWARMAVPIKTFKLTEVKNPNIGEVKPADVRAHIEVDLRTMGGKIRDEWEGIRQHDVLFLITIHPPQKSDSSSSSSSTSTGHNIQNGNNEKKEKNNQEEDQTFPSRYGVISVRGCTVYQMRDEKNNVMNDMNGKPDERVQPVGHVRQLRVSLDAAQYQSDMMDVAKTGADNVYEGFNLLVRRKAKENNFKAVLETIRNILNVPYVNKAVPEWLHDVFLGYGSPDVAHYSNLGNNVTSFDLQDTILDSNHALSAFSDYELSFKSADGKLLSGSDTACAAPFKAQVNYAFEKKNSKKTICLTPYTLESNNPFIERTAKMNKIPFTSVQVEAIVSGMNPGLTMVVGPPGTGKTDVAVQIINNLYHNFPEQKTLIVTHSNNALNDLFMKIMERDIDPRHLVRLGSGSKKLETERDFSVWGSVNYSLLQSKELLQQMEFLAHSLNITDQVGETTAVRAEYFYAQHVVHRIVEYEQQVQSAVDTTSKSESISVIKDKFPFTDFFAYVPQPLFKGKDFDSDMNSAQCCVRYIHDLFAQLKDFKAFEILRSNRQRSDYMLIKQSRIVAMTCTHAALTRQRLVDLGFKYDNIVMEESAQILEVETFIPMVLQNIDSSIEGCRLKRVILIGDHNQLPPVVKNMAFQKYGKLDQSLFARFVRLNVPYIQLDQQGRARKEIADLYRWRYSNLTDLPSIKTMKDEYSQANPGFAHTFQFVDVPDYMGVGESTPSAFFYQNLGEAEYVVAMYQYMRLLGYPAEKISIITTYNGQKHLIRDVINTRCSPYPMFGTPATITTVDRFQGQQNDYILLSMCRTKSVGHVRDVRRLVVAMSRARLGLYVFGRQSLFENCYDLLSTMNQLTGKPTALQLVHGEDFSTCDRSVSDIVEEPFTVTGIEHMGLIVSSLMRSNTANEGGMDVEVSKLEEEANELAEKPSSDE